MHAQIHAILMHSCKSAESLKPIAGYCIVIHVRTPFGKVDPSYLILSAYRKGGYVALVGLPKVSC